MSTKTFFSLVTGVALTAALGMTQLQAEAMKCNTGKCGSAMKQEGTVKAKKQTAEEKKEALQKMKCQSGKCGASKAAKSAKATKE